MAGALENRGKNRGLALAQKKAKEKNRTGALTLRGQDRDEKNRGGLAGGIGYVAGNLGLGLANVGEGILDISMAAGDLLQGDTDMAKYRFLNNMSGNAQKRLQEDYNPNGAMKLAGDVASGIGNSATFLIPYAGPYLAALGYAGMGITSAAEQTGDVGLKELGYGVVSGGMEFLMDKFIGGAGQAAKNLGSSITRKLGREAAEAGAKATAKLAGKSFGKSVLTETLKGAAGEAIEEASQEALDPLLLRLFNIDENAKLDWKNVAYAGLIGGLSGGLMTAGPAAINYKSAVSTGKSIRESGETADFIEHARLVVKGAQRKQADFTAKKEAAKAAKDSKKAKAESGTDTGKAEASTGGLGTFIQGRRDAKASRRVAQLAETIQKNLTAYEGYLNKADKTAKELEISDAILGEMRGNVFLLENAALLESYEEAILELSDEDKAELVAEVNTRARASKAKKTDYTVEDLNKDTDGILASVAGNYLLSENYGRYLRGNQEAKAADASESPVEAARGAETVTGEEVGAPKEATATEEIRAEEEAEAVKNAEAEPVPATRTAKQEEASAPVAEAKKETAPEAGAATQAKEERSTETSDRTEQKPAEKTAEKTVEKPKPTFETDFVEVRLSEGKQMRDLSEEAYGAYNAAKVLGEALHAKIILHETLADVSGRKQNGYYDVKTHEIHVALDAGRGANGTALFTLAHEVTHYIEDWDYNKYSELEDFVKEQIGREKMAELMKSKKAFMRTLDAYKDMDEFTLGWYASDEVIADSMETILSDGKVLEALAKRDKTLWEKIRDWVLDAIRRIKDVYAGLKPNSRAAQVLSETMTDMEKLERLFTEAAVAAGEAARNPETADPTFRKGVYAEGVRDAGKREAESGYDTQHGVMIDDASGTAMFSIDDIPKNQDEVDVAVNRLVAKLGVDEFRARQWVQNELSLATLILRDDMVDYAHRKADRRLTAIVKNSDYKQGTLDFSNICRKRREYTRMMQRIQQAFPNRRFTAEEFATIRKIMVDEGLEVACGLCYVEDRRQNEGYIAETFREAVKSWRKGNRETFRDTKNEEDKAYNKGQTNAMNLIEKGDYLPTIADLTTVEGMEKLQKEHPDILRAWRGFNNARGMASARLLTGEAEYQRQILKYNRTRVKQINDLGGLRIFSFSDFEEFHLLDIIQAVQDCAAMGIKIQFYTKVPSFALLMKDTKAKGNLSLIPKGDLGYVMMNGKPVLTYDPVEGIDFNDPAFKKVVRGNPNIGTILVGINDTQIRAAMEDDYIDYIIPFHSGQSTIVRQIKKIGKWENYKDSQTDKKLDPDSKAKPVNIYTDVIAAAEREGDPIRNERQFVERFLKVCKERGLKPRFEQFLEKNEAGEYVYTKGYYKLLLDFKMFDKDGTYLPQEAVVPEFDVDLLHELTEKYVAGEKAKTDKDTPAFNRALKRVATEVLGEDTDKLYSIDETDDTAYLAAVERGDMETAQRMVNEAAKKWGAIVDETTKTKRPLHLYHGSRDFGFTQFNKRAIFATVKESVAAGYNSGAGLGRVRNASVKYIPNDGTVETAIKNAKSVLGRDLSRLNDSARQETVSKADRILKEVARRISDIDEAIDYSKAEKFFDYLAEKYGEDASMKWTNQLDNMKYMISGEYTAEEILENGDWLEHDLENYSEWKRSLNELWLEEREEIENATLGEAFRYVLGYDYGDKVIDIEFGLGRLLNDREKLVNSNGGLVYLDDIIAAIEEKKSTGIYDLYGNAGSNPLIIDEGNRFWDAIPFDGGFRSTDYIVKWAKEHGYTSVNFKSVLDPSSGGSENVYADEWVFFSPEQVKSADPVTYDDNGNVIPLSERFKEDDPDIRYSIDDSADVSENAADTNVGGNEEEFSENEITDRDLLLDMAEKLVGTEEENRILSDYKAKMDEQKARQKKLDELTDEMRELQSVQMYGEDPAKRSDAAKRLNAIYKEMGTISNEIAKTDRRIIEISGMKVIRNLLTRERLNVRDTYKTKYETMYNQRKEARETTETRRQVRRIHARVNRLLFSTNRKKGIPYEMKPIVAESLKLANMDVEALQRLAELEEQLTKLEQEAVPDQTKIAEKMQEIENQERKATKLKEQVSLMVEIFEKTKDIKEGTGVNIFDDGVLEKLKSLQKDIGGATIRNMKREQLTALKQFYELLYHRINTANNTFATERSVTVDELGSKASDEVQSTKALKFLSPKGKEWAAMDGIRKYFWKNMKPLTVFEAMGSKTYTDLFQRVLDAEGVWAKDIQEAREKIVEAREAHKYKEWDLEKREAVKTKSGTVELSLSERMALYAYAKRHQAVVHLETGGFVLDPRATVKEAGKVLTFAQVEKRLNDSTRYVMDETVMGDVEATLTAEQKAYVDEMQKYLTDMGQKGNQVSRKLYGIDIFNEEFYFPIKVKSEYLNAQTGKTGDPNIKNRGMTKEVVPGAENPLVLQGFDEVMVSHMNSMATYHAFVLPVEDLTRVLNYQPVNYLKDADGNVILDDKGKPKADPDAAKDYSTLKAVIESKYGAEANDYVVQLVRDLNGGARRDAAAGLLDRGITAFKRASTMASLSVLIQQPTSIVRAGAYIDYKYLMGSAKMVDFKNHKELWERVKKYAPVAVIKEMGGYDTGVGLRTSDYLDAQEYEKGERIKGFLSDEAYRAEIFGKGAAYADEAAWIQMFEACTLEQADKLGKSRDSEEVLTAAGDRFEEIIRHTQVYDSTLTRSEYMRSKDTGAKMATAFMAEPTTIVSMVAEAIMRGERGDVKFLRRTAGSVAAAIILNALAVSLIYAMRDDDEDKTYGEKYVSTLTMEIADGFNPAGYLPVARDIVSILQGYEVERTDMALIGNLVDQVSMITSSKRSVTDKVFGVSGAVSAFFGIPLTNVYRDAKGAINTLLGQVDTETTTGAGLSAAVKEEFNTIFKLFDDQTANGYQLYKAFVSGDTAHYNRVAARYESEAAVEQALRKELRERDRRIGEAAEARMAGELDVYESIIEQIAGEGIFERNMIIRAINNEINSLKDDAKQESLVPKDEEAAAEAEEEVLSLYSTSDLNDALERGDREDFSWIYQTLVTSKKEQGKTEAQAKASVKSSVTAYWKKQYIAAWEENNTAEIKRIQSILQSTGLYGSRNEVAKLGQGWVKAYAAGKK